MSDKTYKSKNRLILGFLILDRLYSILDKFRKEQKFVPPKTFPKYKTRMKALNLGKLSRHTKDRSTPEVDFVILLESEVITIEVKSEENLKGSDYFAKSINLQKPSAHDGSITRKNRGW